eukprot:9471616-Pyramimonas_sp.AAC.1
MSALLTAHKAYCEREITCGAQAGACGYSTDTTTRSSTLLRARLPQCSRPSTPTNLTISRLL